MMKKNSRLPIPRPLARRSLYLAVATASQLMIGAQVWAGPEGGQVVGGSGVIDQSGVDTIIHQATDRLAIDWQSFNLGADERVEFIQPSSSSIALNRVLSHNGSEIHGRIDANGHVFLVNPNGVFFGENSQVNVGGIIASGLNIEPSRFMNGDYALQSIDGTEGRVINHGIINAATGGSVTLIGQQASNEGFISANLGAVSLAAGNEAVLTFDSRGLVGVKVTEAVLQNDLGVDAAVINSGEIRAQGGRVLLTASVSEDIFSQAVNHGGMNKDSSVVVHDDGSFTLGAGADVVNTGEINVSVNSGDAGQVVLLGENITNSGGVFADALQGSAGHIELHSVDTTLVTQSAEISAQTANQGSGGDIKVLGNKVGLLDNAEVNTSGANGGGQILIGGDETGSNQQVRNAEFIYLSEATAVKTDALYEGRGGRLITFANDTARIHGELSANGGYAGGNGGFIETSGLKGFELTSTPDITAASGKGGTWLIDPYDITIENTVAAGITPSGDPARIFESSGSASRVNITNLLTVLNAAAGGEVIIRTGGGGTEAGNIRLVNSVGYNIAGGGSATLRLEAHNNIIFDANRFIARAEGGAGSLNVELIANRDGNDANDGNIIFNNGSYINTFGGNFYASGLGFTLPNADAIAVNTGINPVESNAVAGGDITLNMTGAVSLGSAVRTDGGNFTVENSSSFTNNFNNAIIDTSNAFGGGDINIHSVGNIDLGEIDFTYLYSNAHTDTENNDVVTAVLLRVGSVTALSDEGNVTLSHALNFNDTGKRIGAGDNGYDGNLLDDEDTFLSLTATAGDITINGLISDAKWGDARDSLDITLIAGGDINVNADVYTAGGNFTASGATFSSVFIDGDDQTSYLVNTDRANSFENDSGEDNGNATWSNGGNVEISASDSITLGDIVTDLSCTATSPAACTGNLIVAGRDTDNVDVTQAEGSTLVVHGTSSFDVGSGTITLTSDNLFNGSISFTSAGSTSLKNNHEQGTTLGESTILGSFELNSSNGPVTQSGPLIVRNVLDVGDNIVVPGTTEIVANNNTITLANQSNDFEGLVTLTGTTSVELFSLNNLTVGDINVSGTNDRIAGSITLTAENGYLTTGNLTANGGTQSGSQALRNGGQVTLDAEGDITLGSISTIGRNGISTGGSREGGIGGDVEITSSAGDIQLSSITTSGGNGISGGGGGNNRQGGNAGNIDIGVDTSKVITLTGDITARGGLNGGSQTHGLGGGVIFNGDVELSENEVVIDTSFSSLPSGESTRGDISFAGTINSSVLFPLQDLTLIANQITFGGNIGESSRLGVLTIDSTANLDAINRDFYLGSLDSQTHDFSANLINTVGAESANGGSISVLTEDTRTVVINEIDTRGGLSSGANGMAGGSITNITGNNITLGSVNTSGSDGAELGGNAGSIMVTASGTNPVIDLDGDVITQGGAGTAAGTNASAQFNLSSAGTVNLNYVNFYTSSFNVTGSPGLDTITGPDAAITWTTTGFNQGTVTLTPPEEEKGVVTFTSFGAIEGGSEADTFNLGHSLSTGVKGNDGDDNFIITTADDITLLLEGGLGTNTLSGFDRVNDWELNESGNSTLNWNDPVGITFNGMDVIQGGDGEDRFIVNGDYNGQVSGGGGDLDSVSVAGDLIIDLSNANDAFEGVTEVEILRSRQAGGGTLTVTSPSGEIVDWHIFDFDDAGPVAGVSNNGEITHSGSSINFVNFSNLVGGDGNDSFTLSGNSFISGLIDGGNGNNRLSLADVSNTSAYSVELGNGVAAKVGLINLNLSNIGEVQGNDAALSELIVGSGTNTWTIFDFDHGSAAPLTDGVDDGTITSAGPNAAFVGTVNFIDFRNLQGGSGNDTFTFDVENSGSIGRIDGGVGGSDTLIGKAIDSTWTITSAGNGSLSETTGPTTYVESFIGIDNLDGNTGADNFIFSLDAADFGDSDDIQAVISSVSIDGGATGGVNTLDLSGITNLSESKNLVYTLGDSGSNSTTNISQIRGNSSNYLTLAVASGTNTWTIFDFDNASATPLTDGVNDGTITSTGSNAAFVGTVNFIDFRNLQGGSGNDTFTFDVENSGSIGRIDSGGGASNILIGRAADSTWTITGAGRGSLSETTGPTTYVESFVGIDNLDGNTGADNFIFSLDAADFGDSDDIQAVISSVSIDGGATGGVNTLDLSGITNLSESKSLVYTLGDSASNSTTNISQVRGNNSDFLTLAVASGTNTWTIFDFDNASATPLTDGVNDGTITSTGPNAAFVGTVNFIDFKNLQGGSGDDTFTFDTENSGSIGRIDGGVDGSNTLIGKAIDSTWIITSAGTGSLSETAAPTTYVESFIGIHNLEGNTGADNFIFSLNADNFANSNAIQAVINSVSIDGGLGGGLNTLNLSGITNLSESKSLVYTLGDSANNATTNISQVRGNNSNFLTLAVTSGTNTWTIDGVNDGNIISDTAFTGTINFIDFRNLQGGSGDDIFIFDVENTGSIGSIDGGGGANNELIAKNLENIWTLAATNTLASGGSNYADDFSGIQILHGGSVGDTFNINADFGGIIYGGAGADDFVINAWINEIHGEAGSDTFNFSQSNNGSASLLDGGDLLGTDLLIGRNANNTWSLGTTNTLSLTDGADYVSSFNNMDTLQGGLQVDEFLIDSAFSGDIYGGGDADYFTINAAVGRLYGDDANDTFDFSQTTTGVVVLVDGGGGESNTLIGRNTTNDWLISGADSGTVTDLSKNPIEEYVTYDNIQMIEGRSGTDTLSAPDQYNLWIINDANSGTVNGFSFSNIQNLRGNQQTDEFRFLGAQYFGEIDAVGSGNIIDVSAASSQNIAVSFTGEISTVYGVENASIVVGNNTTQRLVGSTTNDVVRMDWIIEDWDGATETLANGVNDGSLSDGVGTIQFLDFANLIGSSLQDVFTFNDSGSITQSIDGVGPSGNEIVGRNTDNDWFVTNTNNGYIEQSGARYLQSFTNIQALSGGDTRDDFVIAAGINFAGVINGGEGANSLSKTDSSNAWVLAALAHSGSLNTNTLFENVQQINGGTGTDTLIAAAQDNAWYISNNNEGSLGALNATSAMLTDFTGIENLTGNVEVDQFTFGANGFITGLIDGGTSSGLTAVIDTMNLTERTGGVSVELGNSNTAGRFHVVNVEQIDASLSNPNNNFLFGASDSAYTWEITGLNTGTVSPTGNNSNEARVSFSSFGNLRGGTNDDRFEISVGEITGSIYGGDGGGIDFVDYSRSLQDVAISIGGSGGLGVTGIDGIEGVIGNNGGLGQSTYNSSISVTGNTNNTWNIGSINEFTDGINDGRLVIALNEGGNREISFENFNVINGSEGGDRFNLSISGQLIGTINGGLGDNVFNASGSNAIQNIHILANAPIDIPVNSVTTNLFGFSEITVNSSVNNSLFSLETDNAWVIGANDAGTLNSDIDFSGFTNLIGGAGQDVFMFSTLTGSSVRSVDGGTAAGSDSVVDRVDLISVSNNVDIGVGSSAAADLNVLNIEQLDARPESNNTLVADNISANIWDIDAENAGSLNSRLAFSGFANLRGRDTADTFNFIGVDAYISGVIDGGVGSDTVNLVDAGRALDVHLVNTDLVVMPNAINVIAIEQVNGSEAFINTLLGSDIANAWVIDGANSGSLNNANNTGLKFTSFENLVGGSNDDTFAFDLGGELDGYVDGGNHLTRDTVDMSLLATVDLQLGSDNTGYRNIERYIGNNAEDSIIRGDDANNIWTLDAGLNRGNIGGVITFEGFANLYGGGGNDTFIFNQGELTGSVNGGAGNDIFNVNSGLVRGDINGDIGNDTLNVTVNETESRLVSFIGGEGINDVTVNGGNQGYRTVHGAAVDAGGELRYTDASGNAYTVAYSDASRVNDNVESSLLTLNGTLQQDEFTLFNNRYSLNGFTDVRYTTKNNLTIAASADDSVYVDAVINIPQRLRVQNASLSGSSTSRINATDLHLDSTGNVGSVDDRLRVNVNNLLVTAARGDIYLEEQNSLNIAEFGSSNRFDIDLLGTLTSNVSLSSPGDFAISAGEDIVLDSANALSGRLDLIAGGEISLANTTNTNLGTIQAQALNVNSTAAINGLGQVTVAGLATFASGGNIELNDVTNSFNSVAVTSAQDVSLVDTGLLILENISMSGLLQTSSATLTQNGSVNVGSAALTATNGLATLGNNITANEAINVSAQGIAVNGGLTGGSITLNGDTGNINLGGKLDANGAGGITIAGNLITQSADIESGGNIAIDALGGWNMASGARLLADAGSVTVTSGGNITTGTINALNNILLESIGSVQLNGNVTSTAGQTSLIATNALMLTGNVSGFTGVDIQSGGNLQQQAQINSEQGDITATVTGDITMASNAVTTATQGSINYGAANIGISTLNAQAGTVTLNAEQGSITNNIMGNNNNVVAQRLVMDAISGIGAIGPIKTQISELSASNFQGNINLENNLELTVDRLRTNGDITLVNTVGDVILDNTNGLRFSLEETDARLAGGTSNANYEIGTLSINVVEGSLLARGPQDLENPDVIAYDANLIAKGDIGSAARPLVVYVKNKSVIFGRRSWGPLWGFGVEPADPVNNSIIQSNLSDLLAAGNEQLVEVETLEEVDPAIFTSVRNYFFDDISIMMPGDQRYDDDEYAD